MLGEEERIDVLEKELETTRENLRAVLEEVARAQKSLESQANKDALTNLLNRRGLEKMLSLEVARAVRSGTWLTALLIDVDNFKQINDSLSHAVGDVVLQEISKRLTDVLRPVDQLARIGGDEFLALLPDTRLAEAIQVAERIRLIITETPLRISMREIQVTASIGVNTIGRETISIEEVIAQTHRSLSQSKKRGKNQVTSESRNTLHSSEREENESTILATLSNEECLRAVAQPIHDVVMDKIVGYELLSRGPKGAFEMPNDFFRVCLQHNMLTMIDLKCLKSCVRWASKFIVGGELHLNLFPSTLLDTNIEQLARALSPLEELDRYCIEISEQQFIGDPSYLRGPVDLLRKRGARIAIDDVGFGRSSLESLIVLEPDVIKIDRSFVHGVDADLECQRNLSRLVHVAEGLGAEVVAEGVETLAELQFVRETGIRFCQGFLWGAAA